MLARVRFASSAVNPFAAAACSFIQNRRPQFLGFGATTTTALIVPTFSQTVAEDIFTTFGGYNATKERWFLGYSSDGLDELALSAEVQELRLLHQHPREERSLGLCEKNRKKARFVVCFRQNLVRNARLWLFVFDFDPFSGGGLLYQLGESLIFDRSHDKLRWDVKWEDQNIRPMQQ